MLVTLSRSPYQRNDYRLNLRMAMAQEGSEVILIQDGVIAVTNAPPEYRQLMEEAVTKGVTFYALMEDLRARGIGAETSGSKGIVEVDYAGMVDLMLKHKKVI